MAAPVIDSDRRLYERPCMNELRGRAGVELECVKVGDVRVPERSALARRFDPATGFDARRVR